MVARIGGDRRLQPLDLGAVDRMARKLERGLGASDGRIGGLVGGNTGQRLLGAGEVARRDLALGEPGGRARMLGVGLQYGGIDVPLFSSMDQALAHAREKIRTW